MVKKKANNKHLIAGLAIIIVTIGAIYGYFKYEELYPSTEDAYINTNLVNVAPKVTGYLETINVVNNQQVHKGDILFSINPVDYKLSVEQAKKNYDSQVAQMEALKKQMLIQKDQTVKDQKQYNFALEVANRYKKLLEANTISQQAYDNAKNNLDAAQKALDIDTHKYQQLQDLYNFTLAKRDQAKVAVDSASSNLGYTHYDAPVDGYITNLKSLTPGEFVNAGQQLFGIVDINNWWVDANFKETQLARIKRGQRVEIKLDMYDHIYKGTVDSISYASGNTFSLLPAENATGNWVKVTQRFTVKIKVESEPNYPLRVGASAKVTIKTN